jgi:hypothetical protein
MARSAPTEPTDDDEPEQPEVPQYKLTEPAYINDRLYAADELIYFTGVPGYHMAPVNKAAKAMVEKHKPRHFDAKLDDIKLPPTP